MSILHFDEFIHLFHEFKLLHDLLVLHHAMIPPFPRILPFRGILPHGENSPFHGFLLHEVIALFLLRDVINLIHLDFEILLFQKYVTVAQHLPVFVTLLLQ